MVNARLVPEEESTRDEAVATWDALVKQVNKLDAGAFDRALDERNSRVMLVDILDRVAGIYYLAWDEFELISKMIREGER